MVDQEIERLLIHAVHSDQKAKQYFMEHTSDESVFEKILFIVESSESGDARMEGAYYVSKFDAALLRKAEARLLKLMDDEWDSVAVHIMMALSRIRSERALQKILDKRVKPVLYWEAMAIKNYLSKE